ncbi:Uncharacterised protein [Streptococcus pneumoniae]|nr:Uncharacterised protein [Streptococcus pneumoniae]
MWSSHNTDNDTKDETDEEFRSPETDFLVQFSSIKVIFIKAWEEFFKNLIQNHDNWVHHVVHVS